MEKLIVLFLMVLVAEGFLPKSAHRVDFCPEANNITAWIKASIRLGCSDYTSKSIKNKKLYHCLPSSFLNETIEFCALSIAIPRGKCPIYNYKNGATVATGISCANFTNGCPSPVENPYHSNSFYKYFACWNINKKSNCYHADKNCSKDETSYQTTVSNDQNIENSLTTTLYQTTTLNDQNTVVNSSIPKWTVIILVIIILILVAIILVGLVCIYRCKRHLTNSKDVNGDKERKPLNEKEYEDKDTHSLILDEKMGQHMKYVDPEKEPLYNTEEDEGHGDVKIESLGTEQRDEDAVKNVDNEPASENSKLKKELSDVEKRSEIKDAVVTEEKVTVKPNAIKPRDENPKEDDDKPEKQDECLQYCMEPNLCSPTTRKNFIENRDTGIVIPKGSGNAKEDMLAFNSFYHDLATKIMENRKIMTSFRVLLDIEPIEHTVNADEMDLFYQWNKEHKFFFNIWHLQELLKKSKAEDLVQECEKFAKKRLPTMKLCYFSRKIKDDGREILIIHTSHDIHDENTRGYMEKIREQLSDRLKKQKSDIKVEGIEEGSLIFLFSVSKLNIKDFFVLSFVRSLWFNGVLKVETKEFTIEPDFRVFRKRLVSSSIWSHSLSRCATDTNYREDTRNSPGKLRQVVVRFKTFNPHFEDDIKMCINTILKKLLKCFGHFSSNNKVFGELATVEINLGLTPKVLLYNGCRNTSILEDMEPSTVLHLLKEQFPKFYWFFENAVKSGKSRSERAKNLIDCLSIFMDNSHILNCVYGKKRMNGSGKEHRIKSTEIQKREAMVKESIKSNWNFLLEEIDSSIIKDTLKSQTCTEKEKASLQENSGMSRRERVKSFLQFILQNDEYLLKFDDVLHKHDLISHLNTNHVDILLCTT